MYVTPHDTVAPIHLPFRYAEREVESPRDRMDVASLDMNNITLLATLRTPTRSVLTRYILSKGYVPL